MGWSTGRWDITLPKSNEFSTVENRLLNLMSKLLRHDSKPIRFGFRGLFYTLPQSEVHGWHADGCHLSEHDHLPPHALTILLPLDDMTLERCAIEVVPGSHLETRYFTKDDYLYSEKNNKLLDFPLKNRNVETITPDSGDLLAW